MSATRQSYLPGHPQPTPESILRDEQITQAFVALGKSMEPVLDVLPSGAKSLTIQRKVAGFRYKLTITPAEEK